MKRLIISMFVLTAVVVTGCSSSSYPTAERYPDNRPIFNDGYYQPGYYGPTYYGGGYYPPSKIYGSPYSRRRPTVIYRSAPPRVIRVNPRNPQGRDNWNRNDRNNNRRNENNNSRRKEDNRSSNRNGNDRGNGHRN